MRAGIFGQAFTQVVTEAPCFESKLIVRSGLHGEAYGCIAWDSAKLEPKHPTSTRALFFQARWGKCVMARITVEDCIDKVPNRFELVLLAAHRARTFNKGAAATVDINKDKGSVLALREIAEKTLAPNDLREGLIHSMQENVEVDEPEAAAAPSLPPASRPSMLGGDDPSTDPHIDIMTEDALLRAMTSLVPEEPNQASGDKERSSSRSRRFAYSTGK